MAKTRSKQRERRKMHIRKSVQGTAEKPRISVFRSNRYLFVQAVDDDAHEVCAALWEKKLKTVKDEKPVARAKRLGQEFGKKLVKAGKKTAVFDRSGYKYHGRVKELADGIRDAGVKF